MIINNVRMESNAGWYLGAIEATDDCPQPYDRLSMYYPNEDWVKQEFPNSISLQEAFDRVKRRFG